MQDVTLQIFQTALAIIGIIVGAFVVILAPIWGYFWNRNRKLEAYYKVMWRKSSKLKPKDLLDHRAEKKYGFNDYYHLRQEDKLIEKKLADNEHILVIGDPLAGKSRAIYEVLSRSKRKYDISIPRLVNIPNPVDIHIPLRFTIWRKRVVVVDDIHKYASKDNFFYLLLRLRDKGVIILATCRSKSEYEGFCKKLEQERLRFPSDINISHLTRETAEAVARDVHLPIPRRFDGNIGFIFVPLEEMRERFQQASAAEKGILRYLKRLHAAGIYREKEVFSIARLRHASQHIKEVREELHQWPDLLEKLKNNRFFEKDNDEISIEETYLEQVIEDDFLPLDNLRNMLEIFSDDPDAAFDIGNEAYNRGLIDLKKAAFMNVAIDAYNKTLAVWTLVNNPKKYAMTQNNLGNAYRTLGEVENKSANCKLAIAAYREALKVYTLDRFPMQYAGTQNNLGNAYRTLGEVENKSANCKLAIAAYQEALKVYTLERFPMDYGMTQNNLGAAYQTLAEAENKVDNCQKAKRAYEEALKIYTEDLPEPHGVLMRNLERLHRFCEDVF